MVQPFEIIGDISHWQGPGHGLVMTDAETDRLGVVWDYMRMDMPLRKVEVIFVTCSLDLRVGEYAVELFKQGYGDYMIFSGNGKGRLTEHLFKGVSEAETFAAIARKAGVPEDKIIIEAASANLGENLRFTHKLLEERGLQIPQEIPADVWDAYTKLVAAGYTARLMKV
jgi:hypothetical protein